MEVDHQAKLLVEIERYRVQAPFMLFMLKASPGIACQDGMSLRSQHPGCALANTAHMPHSKIQGDANAAEMPSCERSSDASIQKNCMVHLGVPQRS